MWQKSWSKHLKTNNHTDKNHWDTCKLRGTVHLKCQKLRQLKRRSCWLEVSEVSVVTRLIHVFLLHRKVSAGWSPTGNPPTWWRTDRLTSKHWDTHSDTLTYTYGLLPVDGCDDEWDGGEADGGRGPLAHRKWPSCGFSQQEERCGTNAVDGESRNGHWSQSLPDKRVDHSDGYPHRLSMILSVSLQTQTSQTVSKSRQEDSVHQNQTDPDRFRLTAAAFLPLSSASADTYAVATA